MIRLQRFLDFIVESNGHLFIDYSTGLSARLEKKHSLVKGVRVRTDYYDPLFVEVNETTKLPVYDEDGKVVTEEYTFTRDADGLALMRECEITWWNEDGSANEVKKSTRKVYSVLERSREGSTRRRNVIDSLKGTVLAFLIYSGPMSQTDAIDQGKAFFGTYDDEVDIYLEADASNLSASVAADTIFTWLDNDLTSVGLPGVTIRQFIMSELQTPHG